MPSLCCAEELASASESIGRHFVRKSCALGRRNLLRNFPNRLPCPHDSSQYRVYRSSWPRGAGFSIPEIVYFLIAAVTYLHKCEKKWWSVSKALRNTIINTMHRTDHFLIRALSACKYKIDDVANYFAVPPVGWWHIYK